MNKSKAAIVLTVALAMLGVTSVVKAQQQPAQPAPPPLPQAPNMTFFVTGAGPGKGADLGGLEGADQHCQQLAQRHGAGGKTWHAYLSTKQSTGSRRSMHATASATVRGRISRVKSSLKTSTICTATTTNSE